MNHCWWWTITVLWGCDRRAGARYFAGRPESGCIGNCRWTCCCRHWTRNCNLLPHQPPPTASLDADWRCSSLVTILKFSIHHSIENIIITINLRGSCLTFSDLLLEEGAEEEEAVSAEESFRFFWWLAPLTDALVAGAKLMSALVPPPWSSMV